MPNGQRAVGERRFQLVAGPAAIEAQLGLSMNFTAQGDQLIAARFGGFRPLAELGSTHRCQA
jgi:hypothetical protein